MGTGPVELTARARQAWWLPLLVALPAFASGWMAASGSRPAGASAPVDARGGPRPDLEDASSTAHRAAADHSSSLAQYRLAPPGPAKDQLLDLLTAPPVPPEVAVAAIQWARQGTTAGQRADGLMLLARLPPTAGAFEAARHAFEQETQGVALMAAVWALQPPGVADPADVAALVPRLHALTRHPAAQVRAASIQRLSQWDRARVHLEADVLRLLDDPAPEVRLAAVGASAVAGMASGRLKRRFMRMLADPAQGLELRNVIAWQMDRFPLSSREFASYQQLHAQISGASSPPQAGR